jgi:hypothetical protein
MATTKTATSGGTHSPATTESGMSPELERMDRELRAFVKERPILALLGAMTTGYLVGRILRRRA